MIKDTQMRIIAIFMIALVLSLPFYSSYVFAEGDDELDQYYGMDTAPYDVSYIEHMPVTEPEETCEGKQKDVELAASLMEDETIAQIAQAISVMQTICSIEAMLKTIVSAINTVLGSVIDGLCCWISAVPGGVAVCEGFDLAKRFGFDPLFAVMDNICCVFMCGLCDARGQCGAFLDTALKPMLASFAPQPSSSIYVALACLCPGYVLVHMRQLKLIYDTYHCCIKEACAQGISTEACEQQFNYQTCVYWDGGMATRAIMNVVTAFVVKIIVKVGGTIISKYYFWLECVLNWWDVVETPITWALLMEVVQDFEVEFDPPQCEDLGFAEIKEDIKFQQDIQPYLVRLADTDGDGLYDTITRVEEVETKQDSITGAVIGKITGKATEETKSEETEYTMVRSSRYQGYELEDGRLILLPTDQKPPRDVKQKTLIITEKPSALSQYKIYENTEDVYITYQGYELPDGRKVLIPENQAPPPGAKQTKVSTDDPSVLEDEEYEKYDKEKIASQKRTNDAIHNTVKRSVDRLFGSVIQKKVDEEVEEKCAKELESSEPVEETPSDQTLGTTSIYGLPQACLGLPIATSLTAQASRSGTTYTFAYNIISCKQDLRVDVRLRGAKYRILESKYLLKGERLSNASSINDTNLYTTICVQTDDPEVGDDGLFCSAIA